MVDRQCQEVDEVPDFMSVSIRGKNKQPEKPLKIKATLVVCPVSLIEQWAQEIKFKTQNLSVLVYHGSNRARSVYDLANYDGMCIFLNIYNEKMNLHLFINY